MLLNVSFDTMERFISRNLHICYFFHLTFFNIISLPEDLHLMFHENNTCFILYSYPQCSYSQEYLVSFHSISLTQDTHTPTPASTPVLPSTSFLLKLVVTLLGAADMSFLISFRFSSRMASSLVLYGHVWRGRGRLMEG